MLRGARLFSSTPRRRDDDDKGEGEGEGGGDGKNTEQKSRGSPDDDGEGTYMSARDMLREAGVLEQYSPKEVNELEKEMGDLWQSFALAERPTPKGPDQFWNEEEEDPEMVMKDGPDEDDPGYDMSSMAHSRLDEIREQRHLARIIVWEMPLLSSTFSNRPCFLFYFFFFSFLFFSILSFISTFEAPFTSY